MTTSLDQLAHTFIKTNSVHLHVVQAGPEDGRLVILLHGFPEFWYGWRKQIPFLAERGYRVWAPDQRGYNLSDKPLGIDAYHLDHLADDIAGLIRASGQAQAVVIGHDWGAAVAWWIAARHPALVEKLVILNVPHPQVMRQAVFSNPLQLLKSWYIGMFQVPLLPETLITAADHLIGAQMLLSTSRPGTFTDQDIQQYTQAWSQPGALTAMINWYRAMTANLGSARLNFRVHLPTLILWGVRDQFLMRELAQASTTFCDDVRLVYFENATHWVQHEEADAVNAEIERFLNVD